MNARRVEAGRGWSWIVIGWQLFLKAPGIWIAVVLIYAGINIALSFLPPVGPLVDTLLTPVFAGGMIYGAAALARGEGLEIGCLFRAFQVRDRLASLLTLGGLLLVTYLIMGLVVSAFVSDWATEGRYMMGSEDGTGMSMTMGLDLFELLIVLLAGLVITMAMFFAVPLVMLGGISPLRSIRDSFSGSMANLLPLLVFSLIFLLLTILATVPMGLGFLVLAPVTCGAIYASYQDIFAENGPGARSNEAHCQGPPGPPS